MQCNVQEALTDTKGIGELARYQTKKTRKVRLATIHSTSPIFWGRPNLYWSWQNARAPRSSQMWRLINDASRAVMPVMLYWTKRQKGRVLIDDQNVRRSLIVVRRGGIIATLPIRCQLWNWNWNSRTIGDDVTCSNSQLRLLKASLASISSRFFSLSRPLHNFGLCFCSFYVSKCLTWETGGLKHCWWTPKRYTHAHTSPTERHDSETKTISPLLRATHE